MIITIEFFSKVNYVAVLVAGLVYFALGAIWYSLLFGKMWSKGIQEMGIKMNPMEKGAMGMMMLKSFLWNMLSVIAMAYFIHVAGAYSAMAGFKLGLAGGAGVALGCMGMNANWQGTKRVVLMVDAGYQIIGLALASTIIGCWH